MARKNLLAGLADTEEAAPASAGTYPMRGASKTMIRSLDELARQADKFLEGEAVIEIDPADIDGSFVSDRLEDDEEQFEALKSAIAERGQDSPVLLRPHPDRDGRYQIVFGHRRVRAARELGRAVRAVVKAIDDRSHVIAQGQENSARANLSFIERALFAKRLEELGYGRDVIGSALAANAAALSKMVSVTSRIGEGILSAIGPARGVGRERWVELSLLAGKESNAERIEEIVSDPSFRGQSSDERFNGLYLALKQGDRPVRKSKPAAKLEGWQTKDKLVSAQFSQSAGAFSMTLKAKSGPDFGRFVAENLDRLYSEYLSEKRGR
ncbi:chromosome partitioning protein, ParB family [Ensifer adhaerens]|nr:chromosome partitioning protein, ParB family [Ensifer adhaerens]